MRVKNNRPKSEGTQYWVVGNVIFLGLVGAYTYAQHTGQDPLYCWLGGLNSKARRAEVDEYTMPVA